MLRTWFGGEDEGRWAGCGYGAGIGKAGFGEPCADLFEGVGTTFVGVDEHVDGEEEAADGAGAVGVYEELGDGYGAAGSECGEDFGEKSFAAFDAFAVENVAECGGVVAGAEVGFV